MNRRNQTRIFFPWEHRGGALRRLGLNRFRPALLFLALVLLTVWVGARERRDAGERRTRAVLEHYRSALENHLAAKEGHCPKSLAALQESAEIETPPRDAWGHPLRLVCPWQLAGQPYLLSSDGPDGLPGGLDRIE